MIAGQSGDGGRNRAKEAPLKQHNGVEPNAKLQGRDRARYVRVSSEA